MNSSNWLVRRDAPRKDDSYTTGVSYRFRQSMIKMLYNFFYSLSAANLWFRALPVIREFKCREIPTTLSPEKVEFLKTYGNEYGYADGSLPVDELRAKEFARLEGTVYLDHAGATLYTETQLKSTLADLSANLYGNPHSQSASSILSSDAVESARNQVLAMCNASPEEYICVFTSGATAALKLVGETFPWSCDSQYMYTVENHNSVLGIREYAFNQGASVIPVDVDTQRVNSSRTAEASNFHFRQRTTQMRALPGNQECSGEAVYNLFAFPSECNFSGSKVDLGLIPFVQQAQHVDTPGGQWFVLLDAAKGCSTGPPNLSSFHADFVAISFYKIFGYPTGLGALLVRKDAAKLMKKKYFGGGTVAVSIADDDFIQRRQRLEQWLEDGTVSFLSIAGLRHGFSVINRLQMSAINKHAGCLASYTAAKLADLKHGNNRKVCVIYGNHKQPSGNGGVRYWGPDSEQGPIVSFNMNRADGSWIGSKEVEKLATLSGIHLRTGCFCNPGACAKYLGLSSEQMKANFEAGHVCWDDKDVINGCPTGAVRVSFGYMSTFEDCWAFLHFIKKFFVEQHPQGGVEPNQDTCSLTNCNGEARAQEPVVSLQSITVYPIKSCSGFKTNAWPLGKCGLLYDREWLVMSTSGEVLTQKKCPLMCSIQTYVDLESASMHVQAPNMKDGLSVPLTDESECILSGDVLLCGDSVGLRGSGARASQWFTEALGTSCKLVKRDAKGQQLGKSAFESSKGAPAAGGDEAPERSFANEGQFLLISKDSIEDLNHRLLSSSSGEDGPDPVSHSGQSKIHATRFRPNFVVSGHIPYDEDNWQALVIGGQRFKVLGGCNRCKMVNIDQKTGQFQPSSEPLVTLATYRRVKGRIYFGILLEQEKGPASASPDDNVRVDHILERQGSGDVFRRRRHYYRVLRVGQRLEVTKRAVSKWKDNSY